VGRWHFWTPTWKVTSSAAGSHWHALKSSACHPRKCDILPLRRVSVLGVGQSESTGLAGEHRDRERGRSLPTLKAHLFYTSLAETASRTNSLSPSATTTHHQSIDCVNVVIERLAGPWDRARQRWQLVHAHHRAEICNVPKHSAVSARSGHCSRGRGCYSPGYDRLCDGSMWRACQSMTRPHAAVRAPSHAWWHQYLQ